MMLQAVLSRYDFAPAEFGRVATAKVYDENFTAFDADTYTVTAIFETVDDETLASVACSDAGATVGEIQFQFTESAPCPTKEGIHTVRFKFVKSGEQLFTKPIKVIIR